MPYTIDEKNLERQQLLAEILNPLMRPVLERIPRAGVHNVLDLGCGQGNTTRFLASYFTDAELTGLEYDENLVTYARSRPENTRVRFEQGDAAKLPFPDASFDLVFTRYLLLHMPDPDQVIDEMFRVLRPGGRAFSFEPDCCMDVSYPDNPGLKTMTHIFQKLFAQPHIGRQLVHRFRRKKPATLQAGACLGLEHEGSAYRSIYRMTAEAMGAAASQNGVLTSDECATLVEHMKDLEAANDSIMIKLPDFWVIATR